jgi:hypothetical protein
MNSILARSGLTRIFGYVRPSRLQLIMAKTRHKSPRTVMRYVKPGDEAVAGVTSLLAPPAHPLNRTASAGNFLGC